MYKKLRLIAILLVLSICFTSCVESIPSNDDTSSNTSIDKDNNSDTALKNDEMKLDLLKNINNNALNGKVINCEFAVESSNIDSVIQTYGEANNSEFIEAAKGQYYTFANKSLVFGCNKGSQVFEIRSFDKKLSTLTLNDITKFFGPPQYNIVTSLNENIIGYVISPELKLEFILPNNDTNDSSLHHYCVFWPKGTVNSMAGDYGREW